MTHENNMVSCWPGTLIPLAQHPNGYTPSEEDVSPVGRLYPTEDDDVGISTVWAGDVGRFETALLSIKVGTAVPVERYDTREEAIKGHEKWMEKRKSVTKVTSLGAVEYGVDDFEVNIR